MPTPEQTPYTGPTATEQLERVRRAAYTVPKQLRRAPPAGLTDEERKLFQEKQSNAAWERVRRTVAAAREHMFSYSPDEPEFIGRSAEAFRRAKHGPRRATPETSGQAPAGDPFLGWKYGASPLSEYIRMFFRGGAEPQDAERQAFLDRIKGSSIYEQLSAPPPTQKPGTVFEEMILMNPNLISSPEMKAALMRNLGKRK